MVVWSLFTGTECLHKSLWTICFSLSINNNFTNTSLSVYRCVQILMQILAWMGSNVNCQSLEQMFSVPLKTFNNNITFESQFHITLTFSNYLKQNLYNKFELCLHSVKRTVILSMIWFENKDTAFYQVFIWKLILTRQVLALFYIYSIIPTLTHSRLEKDNR